MDRQPLTNRVMVTGEIVAHPARGLFMGNRGILHDRNRRVGRVLWRHKAWIICSLAWKDNKRSLMAPGAYTELFFLDEAVALAAGHRPCALCRRPAYNAYRSALHYTGTATDLDKQLHAERAIPRRFAQRRHVASISELPDGAVILSDVPYLVLGKTLRAVTPTGYGATVKRPDSGPVTVLTPETSLAALAGGYSPILHHSTR